MTIARLASFLLWAVQFRIYSIPLQEFVFYVQNYCKTILCWISILTYFIGLMKALRQELISTKFFFFFFSSSLSLVCRYPFPAKLPRLEVADGLGQSKSTKTHYLSSNAKSSHPCCKKHQFISRFKSIQKHCRRNIHLFCVWEK